MPAFAFRNGPEEGIPMPRQHQVAQPARQRPSPECVRSPSAACPAHSSRALAPRSPSVGISSRPITSPARAAASTTTGASCARCASSAPGGPHRRQRHSGQPKTTFDRECSLQACCPAIRRRERTAAPASDRPPINQTSGISDAVCGQRCHLRDAAASAPSLLATFW